MNGGKEKHRQNDYDLFFSWIYDDNEWCMCCFFCIITIYKEKQNNYVRKLSFHCGIFIIIIIIIIYFPKRIFLFLRLSHILRFFNTK
jgi:hypothetical protein